MIRHRIIFTDWGRCYYGTQVCTERFPYQWCCTEGEGWAFLRLYHTGSACPSVRPWAVEWLEWWACGTFVVEVQPWLSDWLPPCCPASWKPDQGVWVEPRRPTDRRVWAPAGRAVVVEGEHRCMRRLHGHEFRRRKALALVVRLKPVHGERKKRERKYTNVWGKVRLFLRASYIS